jgi:hypothetical protein
MQLRIRIDSDILGKLDEVRAKTLEMEKLGIEFELPKKIAEKLANGKPLSAEEEAIASERSTQAATAALRYIGL